MSADRMAATRRLGLRDGAEIVAIRRAVVEVVRGPDKGKSVELGEREHAVLGTDPEGAIVLGDDSVSRRHAELSLTEDGWLLRDLGSTNGTRVAGVRIR
jgi:pSer/pThr/pTyr-binding forkhead associated (FHA) protein